MNTNHYLCTEHPSFPYHYHLDVVVMCASMIVAFLNLLQHLCSPTTGPCLLGDAAAALATCSTSISSLILGRSRAPEKRVSAHTDSSAPWHQLSHVGCWSRKWEFLSPLCDPGLKGPWMLEIEPKSVSWKTHLLSLLAAKVTLIPLWRQKMVITQFQSTRNGSCL